MSEETASIGRGVDWLVRWRLVLLLVGVCAVLLAVVPARRLDFDRSMENMFAANDPLLGPYLQLKRVFGGNEIALVAYDDGELLTPAGLARLERLTVEIKQVPGVRAVLSVTSGPLGASIGATPFAERMFELFEGYTISADRRTAAVACLLLPEEAGSVRREETVRRLAEVAQSHGAVVTGEPVMIEQGFRHIEDDGVRLGIASTVLLAGVIALSFRSLRWVIAPLAVVQAAWWLTRAFLAVSGQRLSMVSSMLWAIVTVIGVGIVVHVIVAFRSARSTGESPVEAIRSSLVLLAMPIVWTCLTDAAGFGSLLAAHVGPVQDFGRMMAAGSLVTLVCVAMLIPGMAVAGPFQRDPRRAWGEDRLDLGLGGLAGLLKRHPAPVFVCGLVVSVAVGAGSLFVEVETDFTRNFRADSEMVAAYEFVETRLGGAGAWDLIVPVPHPLDESTVAKVRRLQERLRAEVAVADESGTARPGLTKVLSVVDVLDATRESVEIVNLLPFLRRKYTVEGHLKLLDGQLPGILETMLAEDSSQPGRHYLRIMLRSQERQPASSKTELIREAVRIAREEIPQAEAAGSFVMLTALVESIARDQWLTFGVATVGIGLLLFAAYRRLTWALVGLVPNVLPVFMVTGVLGWLGLKMNMGAAMIAAVSMGMSVDSSVHYFSAYQRARSEGLAPFEAIRRVHQLTGRAMVFSTLALVAGFSTLATSDFVPTIYFGALMGLTMIGGLAGNLVMLPVLLAVVDGRRKSVPAEATGPILGDRPR